MVDPTDEEIAAWAEGFIRQKAYNRPVALQIAMEAAKWVRGRNVQVGWYSYSPAGLVPARLRPLDISAAELEDRRKLGHVYPVYLIDRAPHGVKETGQC